MMLNHPRGDCVESLTQESGPVNSTSLVEISGAVSDMIELSGVDGGLLATSTALSLLQVVLIYQYRAKQECFIPSTKLHTHVGLGFGVPENIWTVSIV